MAKKDTKSTPTKEETKEEDVLWHIYLELGHIISAKKVEFSEKFNEREKLKLRVEFLDTEISELSDDITRLSELYASIDHEIDLPF